ncbi:hypothetical protein [Aeromonas sp. QDB20]|uniref:hypothetical protein n=1 Tax=Aeromonas sp. QDB20 TaxID=2989835 RepID=UPI0022E5962B|nr:hypothetical protein [Aeromonas sp. QDB20]
MAPYTPILLIFMTEIILDLDKSEFDEFNLGKDELWQQDAANQLIKHLTTLGCAAKKIKEKPSNTEDDTVIPPKN